VVGTPSRITCHQETPCHLQHLLNNIVSMESKASVNTLMVGTPQVLGTYDMYGYIHGVSIDMVIREASYT
jgi:hypothetical protein